MPSTEAREVSFRRDPPHSHSIILSYGNALIFRCNFFLRTSKNRLPDPSEICALDFKREFHRFGIRSVSATIGINWSIFYVVGCDSVVGSVVKKTVSTRRSPPTGSSRHHFSRGPRIRTVLR